MIDNSMDRKLGVLIVAVFIGFVMIAGCLGGSDTKYDRAFEDELTSFLKDATYDVSLINDSIEKSDFDTIVRKAPEMKDRAYAHQQAIKDINVSPSLTNAKTTFDEVFTKYISLVTNMEIAAQHHISGDENAFQVSIDKSVEDAEALMKAIVKMLWDCP